MSNLSIIQTKSSTEQVTSAVIETLYRLALTSKVADPSSSFTMSLQGNISAPAAYQDSVEYLQQKFQGLIINIPVGKFYLRFKDPVIEQWCITRCGDGVGVTQADAAGIVKTSDFWGHGNAMTTEEKDQITSLDDFKYFTGTPSISSPVIQGINNATEITFPSVTFTYSGLYTYRVVDSTKNLSNINYSNVSFICTPQPYDENNNIGGYIEVIRGNDTIVDWSSDLLPNQTDFYRIRLFLEWNKIQKIIFPEGITRTYENFSGCKSLQYVEFPSTITDLGSWLNLSDSGSNSYVIVIKATTPPECEYYPNNNDYSNAGWGWHKFPTAIYVPDSAVNTYKNVSARTISSAKFAPQLIWVDQNIKDRIKPLSELPTSYRQMGTVTQADIDRV